MGKENVFPIRSVHTPYGQGNCFVDESGHLHTAAHILENKYSTQTSLRFDEGAVFLPNELNGFEFTLYPLIDYAKSTEDIVGSYQAPKMPFATNIPRSGSQIKLTCAFPSEYESSETAYIKVFKLGQAVVNRVIFTTEDRIVKGRSGSMISWEQPGVFGPNYQQKTEPRILGVLIGTSDESNLVGIVEICPQVYDK